MLTDFPHRRETPEKLPPVPGILSVPLRSGFSLLRALLRLLGLNLSSENTALSFAPNARFWLHGLCLPDALPLALSL